MCIQIKATARAGKRNRQTARERESASRVRKERAAKQEKFLLMHKI